MKTPGEIKEWLEKQEWYPQFYKNICDCKDDEGRSWFFSHLDSSVVISAFVWDKTPEGSEFWIKVDIAFSEWYQKED